MSTLTTALTYARTSAATDISALTDANGLIWANAALLDIRREFIRRGIDAAQVQEAYRDGVIGTGTYLYPADMFMLKTLELNYTDSTQTNYVTADQIDVANLPGGSFDWLRINQGAQKPLFDDRGDWFEIFPTPAGGNNVTKIAKIFYYLQPTEYATVGDTLAYPETLDYRILGKRIWMYYWRSLGRAEEAKMLDEESIKDIANTVQLLSMGEETPQRTQGIRWTGGEF